MIPEPVYVGFHLERQDWYWPIPGADAAKRDDPMIYVHPLCAYINRLVASWDRGVLPCPGTLLDQPARLVAAINLWKRADEHCRYLLTNPKETAEVPNVE